MTSATGRSRARYTIQRAALMLPLVCGLGCLGDMNPGANGPAKSTNEPVKPAVSEKPSSYAVPDFPETTKTDTPLTPATEKPVNEPATEKPALPAAVTSEKPATEKPAEEKPTPKPEDKKPTESDPQTPASAPASTASEAKPPFKDDPFPNGEPVSKDEPKKDATPES